MADEIQTDATKALADVKGVIAAVDADAARVKTFWNDYRFYLVGLVILVAGIILGYHLHK
jgi:hypothetical protein